MFSREYLLNSAWYHERLAIKQQRDVNLWQRHLDYMDNLLQDSKHSSRIADMDIQKRRQRAMQKLNKLKTADYLQSLVGTLGADPLGPYQSIRH
jgi:hypothetical protein